MVKEKSSKMAFASHAFLERDPVKYYSIPNDVKFLIKFVLLIFVIGLAFVYLHGGMFIIKAILIYTKAVNFHKPLLLR